MGNYLGRSKEEWSEVYNNGSPGSPDSDIVAAAQQPQLGGKGGKKRFGGRSMDPRSISDDVERTPIQTGSNRNTPDAEAVCTTPLQPKNQADKFKAAIDPRSPSGLPRTPILVQDDLPKETDETPTTSEEAKVVEEDKIPRRGATLSLAKKLELEEEERGEKEDVEECPKELEKTEDIPEEAPINEEAVVEPLKPAEDVDDNEAKNPDEGTVAENFQRIEEETADENAVPLGGEAAGLSLPRIPDQLYLGPPRFGGDCRSPLLIESSPMGDMSKTEGFHGFPSQKKSRIPLRVKAQNATGNKDDDEGTTAQMMKNINLRDESLEDNSIEDQENSLVI